MVSSVYYEAKQNEAKGEIVFTQWVYYKWNDVFLKWNPNDYGGLDNTVIWLENLWKPDVVIMEQ